MKHLRAFIFEFIYYSLLFFYFWRWVNPSFYFQWQEPVFLLDTSFFFGFLTYPGGLVEYAAAFFAQFYSLPVAGALLITMTAWLISRTTYGLLKSVRPAGSFHILHHFPTIFLLILHNNYLHPLAGTLGFLIALFFANIYFRLTFFKSPIRLVIFILAGTTLFYLAPAPTLLFTVLCAIHALLVSKRPLASLLYLLYGTILPWLGSEFVFNINLKNSYFTLFPAGINYQPGFAPYLLYFSVPLLLIFVLITNRETSDSRPRFHLKYPGTFRVSQELLLLAGTVIAAIFTFDANTRAIIQVDDYAQKSEWEQVLTSAKGRTAGSQLITFHVNRALFHSGKLLDEMFQHDQHRGAKGLILDKEFCFIAPMQISDLYFELGHINEAQHWAHEALMIWDRTPRILQRLAQVNIIKQDYNAASQFLNVLERTLFFQNKAGQAQRDSAYQQEHPIPASYRKRMPRVDFVVNHDYPRADLLKLLAADSTNKMAFEYFMAYNLLLGRLNSLVENIPLLKGFGHHVLPKHYEEALLIFMAKTGQTDLDLQRFRIRPATRQQFLEFNRIVRRFGNDVNAARNELAPKYRQTYWFYILFIKP